MLRLLCLPGVWFDSICLHIHYSETFCNLWVSFLLTLGAFAVLVYSSAPNFCLAGGCLEVSVHHYIPLFPPWVKNYITLLLSASQARQTRRLDSPSPIQVGYYQQITLLTATEEEEPKKWVILWVVLHHTVNASKVLLNGVLFGMDFCG